MSIQEIMSRMNSRKTVTSAVTAKEAADLILKVAKKHFTGRKVYVDARPNKIELDVLYNYKYLVINFNIDPGLEKPIIWIDGVEEPVFDFPGADSANRLRRSVELKTQDIQRLLKLLMTDKDYTKKVVEDYNQYVDSLNGFLKEINSLVTE